MPAGASKSKVGIGKIVVGVALAAAAVALAAPTGGASGFALSGMQGSTGISFGSIGVTGISMILEGASSLLAQSPKTKSSASREAPNPQTSFLFNGPVHVPHA